MLFIAFLGLALATVPLFRGRVLSLAEVRFRALWALGAALAIQAVFLLAPHADLPDLYGSLHVTSYVLAGIFLWANRKLPGAWLIALGGALNLLAIAANQGIMPASPEALAAAGLVDAPRWFTNSAALPDPNLSFLGDVFAIPPPFPFRNVFSPGDILIGLGGAFAVHRLCGSRLVPSGRGQLAPLWGYRDFRRLWAAQAVSNIGDWTYALAVATMVAGRAGAAHVLALLLIAEVAPAAVAGALGGPLIDRLPRRALMVGSDLLRGVAVATLLIQSPPSLAHVYVVAVCLGLFRALFQPTLQASLPNVVPHSRLVAANALISATYHLAVMIGPLLGGFLVTAAGPTAAFALNAGSFLLSAVLVAGVHLPRREAFEKADSSPWQDLLEGARYSITTPLVRGVLLVTGLVMLAASIRTPLEPLFVLGTLGGKASALGLAGGAWGLGMILGSVAAPAAAGRWRRERLLGVSAGAVGLCVLAASRATSLPPVLLLWLASGAANALGTVSYESLLQERTPDALRGRVMAASEAVLDGTFLAGVSAAGWLGTSLGIRGAYAISGAAFLLTAVLSQMLLSSPRRTRQFDLARERAASESPS
ncbi:MAG TPA: MFS transporter [Actinomycetota bacterium]|jgi:MFS family permease|nr:MFS transporter [Actinomycetota bacterium]